jgi:AbrB family looped-hinge helix DNA binding protein
MAVGDIEGTVELIDAYNVGQFLYVLPYGKIVTMKAYRTVISSKGQVVIPAELREQFGLKKGTPATWIEEKGRLVLTPITERRLDEIMGFLKPGPGEPSMFEELFAERERERKREKQ